MSTENEWAASMIGRTLDGQYRLDGILGEGAMGVVFAWNETERQGDTVKPAS